MTYRCLECYHNLDHNGLYLSPCPICGAGMERKGEMRKLPTSTRGKLLMALEYCTHVRTHLCITVTQTQVKKLEEVLLLAEEAIKESVTAIDQVFENLAVIKGELTLRNLKKGPREEDNGK